MLLPFARMSNPGEAPAGYSGERLVNYFARPVQGLTELALMCRSGLVQHARLGTGRVEAMTKMGGDLYAVAGGTVYKVSTAGVVTALGSVATGRASMAANSSQVAIVAGGNYYLTDGVSVTQYTPGALTSALEVEYMDGYFVVIGSTSSRDDAIQISALDDGTSFNALDFAFAEESPDALVAVLRDHGELWLFGEETTQVFYNSGDPDFPFQPNRGALIEHGCFDGRTVDKADNATFWVRPDRAVVRSSGSSPQVISTPEVKEALDKSTIIGGFTFSDRGAEFYAILREDDTTLVFDITTGLWHERDTGTEYAPWPPSCQERLANVQYFGCADGRIAIQDAAVFTDFGGDIAAEAISMPVNNGGERFVIAKVHMNIRGGYGDIGRTPRAMMQTSQDGVTWGRERFRPIGGLGHHHQRVTWHSLGQYRRAQMRIRITDPVARDIHGVQVSYG